MSTRKDERDKLQSGTAKRIVLPGGGEMGLAWCPSGTFTMGSLDGFVELWAGKTQHQVTLTHGFWLAKTQVTDSCLASVTTTWGSIRPWMRRDAGSRDVARRRRMASGQKGKAA